VQASEIRVGDVLSVENASGIRVTHRVVRVNTTNGIASVSLKGDANGVPDAAPYTVREADRVIFSAPLLGYVVAWLNSSAAVFAGGLFTAYLLYLAFGHRGNSRPPRDEDNDGKPGSSPDSRRILRRHRPARHTERDTRGIRLQAGTTVVSVLVLTCSALFTAAPSQAAFTDSSAAAGSYKAASLGSPTLGCTNSGNYDVTLTLTHPGDFATQYELRSLLPAKQWAAASWQAGSPVSVTIYADDDAFTYSQQTTVTFQASSKFKSWTSSPASETVDFRPATLLSIIRARLRCT
jgi:hypothetical protein